MRLRFGLKFYAGWAFAYLLLSTGEHALGAEPTYPEMPAGLCGVSLLQLAKSLGQVKKSSFEHERELGSYQFHFAGPLERALEKRLDGTPQTWIDLGAGNALALREFLLEHEGSPLHGRWSGVAIGVEAPKDPKYIEELRRLNEKGGAGMFRYLTGFLSALPKNVLPQADLITDFFGALSYTPTLSSDLRTSLSLLKPGGRMIVAMLPQSFDLRVGGKEVVFADFVANISGVKLEATENPGGIPSYTLVRTTGPLRVPELVLTKFHADKPPVRHFELGPAEWALKAAIRTTDVAAEHQRIIESYRNN